MNTANHQHSFRKLEPAPPTAEFCSHTGSQNHSVHPFREASHRCESCGLAVCDSCRQALSRTPAQETGTCRGPRPRSIWVTTTGEPRQEKLVQELLERLRQAGATVRAMPEPPRETELEGETFQDAIGNQFDSLAAYRISQWAQMAYHDIQFHDIQFRNRPFHRLKVLMDLMMESPHTEVNLANLNQGEATAFTLADNSRLLAVRAVNIPEYFTLYRLTGPVTEHGTYWMDWGYEPPLASLNEPLPGNLQPPVKIPEP